MQTDPTRQLFEMTINGRAAATSETVSVINPATGRVFAQAPNCTAAQLDEAVIAATTSFRHWRSTQVERRRETLCTAATCLEANQEELAVLTTMEQGKPLAAARLEVQRAAEWMRSVAQLPLPLPHRDTARSDIVETTYVPLGPVCIIAAWNVPVTLAIRKSAPALLAGNTVVLKPSPLTPLATLRIGQLFSEILPEGVFNVISGGDELGPRMTEHPGFAKISFTGSTATGKRVMAAAARDLKRVTLELGGNDAAIVMDDVDVERVAESIFIGAFANSGQVCVATKRLYVHEAVYDDLKRKLVDLASQAKLGDGLDPDTQFGPLQNQQQYLRVQQLLAESAAEGLTLIKGPAFPGAGYFIPLTLIDNPPESSRVVREEAFGPVLPMMKFSSVEDVIDRANSSEYGLAGSVWSGNLSRAREIASRIETGTVWINHNLALRADVPFAGHKQSGIGVEYGADGLLEFMIPKTVYVRPL